MDFFTKHENNPFADLLWNIPDSKQGIINIIGGNSGSFRTPVKTAEFLSTNYPVESVRLVLPDALAKKLPPLDNLVFLSSTDSGSFKDSAEISAALTSADFNILIGDLSKNAITGKALTAAILDACKATTESPDSQVRTLITRDTIDLIAENQPDRLLMQENLIFFASMPQLQKLFRAVYYPKVLTLSQPILQIAEALHKFTLSYPASLITLNNGQILIAKNGEVHAVSLENTNFTPITLWSGELAAKIAAINLYNPNNFMGATVAALFTK